MTPPDDLSERLDEIRERYESVPWNASGSALRERTLAEEDVPYLLSLVEAMRDQLCKYTCECGPSANPDPEEHADYCLYRSALRDAAQEGAE